MLQLVALAMHSAVVTVTAPVFALLFLILLVDEAGWLSPEKLFKKAGKAQPAMGAMLSAVPGCAGSLTLTRLYTAGAVSGATLLAGHLATMGDASFVLWTGRPLATLGLLGIVLVIGIGAGLLSQRFNLSQTPPVPKTEGPEASTETLPWLAAVWVLLALAVGLDTVVGLPALAGLVLGVALAGVSLWSLRAMSQQRAKQAGVRAILTTVRDAAEITLWVMAADVVFTVAAHGGGAGIIQLLHGNLMLDVAIGALVGLIPGCGPQIVVATLFVTGNLPFAAVLANTLSQHGDAIFPLLSSARRTAWRLSVTGGAVGAAAGLLWAVAFR
jgi:hypothetical protein